MAEDKPNSLQTTRAIMDDAEELDLPPSTAMMVINSWDKLKQGNPDIGPLVGKLIFGKFFQVEPKAKELFPSFFINDDHDDETNNNNANKQGATDGSSSLILFENETWAFQLHSQKVVETFDYAVTSLIDLDRNILVDMGEKHVSYLVKGKEDTDMPEFFAPLGEALLYALETGMQDYWDSSLKEAWTVVITFIATSMTEGMHRGMANRNAKRKRQQLLQQQQEEEESPCPKESTQTPTATEISTDKISPDRTETSTSTLSESTNPSQEDAQPAAIRWRQRFKQRTRELSCVFGVSSRDREG